MESLNYIKGNPVCLLCVNINSYAGGGSDVWWVYNVNPINISYN